MSETRKVSTLHIYYSGLVQGVGFRFICQRYANQTGVKGWVKNLSDGRVEAVLQGDDQTIGQFVQNIDKHFEHNITDKQITPSESNEEFEAFGVRY